MGHQFDIMAISLSGMNDDDQADTAQLQACAGLLGASLEDEPSQLGIYSVMDLVRDHHELLYVGAIPGGLICLGDPVRDWAWDYSDKKAFRGALHHSRAVAVGAYEGTGTFYYLVAEDTIQRKVVLCEGELFHCVGEPLAAETTQGIDNNGALIDMLPVYGTNIVWELLSGIVDPEIFDTNEPREFFRGSEGSLAAGFSSLLSWLLRRFES